MGLHTRGKRTPQVFADLRLCPMYGDDKRNEHIADILLDAVQETGLTIAQILNQESRRVILQILPQEYSRIVPNYRQFLKFMDRMQDGGAYQNSLARMEEELLFQQHNGSLNEIINDPNRETRKTEFSMRAKMTTLMMNRRKVKAEATITEKASEASVLNSMTDEQLQGLKKMIDVTPEGTDGKE